MEQGRWDKARDQEEVWEEVVDKDKAEGAGIVPARAWEDFVCAQVAEQKYCINREFLAIL